MRINSNSMAINAYRNLSTNNMSLGKSLEKLSSGFRINRAADDAAGLVISQNLRAQVSGLRQATRNAQDGISVVQTAEGALNEVHTMLNRMRDLSVQAANSGANDASARTAAQSEITALTTEIDRIANSTQFGGTQLLDGSYGVTSAKQTGFDADDSYTTTATETFTININGTGAVSVVVPTLAADSGADAAGALAGAINSALSAASNAFAGKVSVTSETVGAGSALTIEVTGLADTQTFVTADTSGTPLADLGITPGTSSAAAGTGGQFQIGANATDTLSVSISAISSATLGISGLNVTTDAGAAAAITAFDTAISSVSTQRGTLGAVQNRFESMINNLQVTTENLVASESRIRDTDMASEMTNFTKNQILTQAGTAMLAQANQVPQGVLSLLR